MINYNDVFMNKGLSYEAYRQLIDEGLAEGRTTGADHSAMMVDYAKMNLHRMVRLDKTVMLNEALLETLDGIQEDYRLLVITEGWCGDAAQLVPVFEKIASAAPEKFELRLVLRDQNTDLIDQHLTNGGRAIPILLVLDSEGKLVKTWGPRPEVLKPLLAAWNKESEDMMVVAEKLHGWYAKDKTQSTQRELSTLLSSLN